MVISYLGLESFKVQFGDIVLAFNPVSKDSKLKAGSFGADVALISLNHPDTNSRDQASRGEREAFVIDGPGEYEVQGVFIKGAPSVSHYGGEERINTIYSVSLEGMNLCFLGALGDPNISSEAKSMIDEVDVLFVPVGGNGVLNSQEAYKFAVSLEPKIIIPMHYDDSSLKSFLKEAGVEGLKKEEKLTIKKKDIEGKEGEVVVLSSQ